MVTTYYLLIGTRDAQVCNACTRSVQVQSCGHSRRYVSLFDCCIISLQ